MDECDRMDGDMKRSRERTETLDRCDERRDEDKKRSLQYDSGDKIYSLEMKRYADNYNDGVDNDREYDDGNNSDHNKNDNESDDCKDIYDDNNDSENYNDDNDGDNNDAKDNDGDNDDNEDNVNDSDNDNEDNHEDKYGDNNDSVDIDGEDNNDDKYSGNNDSDNNDGDDYAALDGGWGYAVLLGTFIIMITMGIISRCFGILFISFLNELGTSSAMVATIFNCESFFWSGANLVSGPLAEVFGFRSVAMVGCMLISVGFLISAVSTSAVFLIFSHSLLTGFGSGICCLVCFAIIPIYFRRLRGWANAITISGISIGGIFGPPTITHLQENYGFRGATVIVAGFMLNNCVAASLFHPIAWHRKTNKYKLNSSSTPSERFVLCKDEERSVTNVSDCYNRHARYVIMNKTAQVTEQEKMEEVQLLEVNVIEKRKSVCPENNSPREQELRNSHIVHPNKTLTLTKMVFQRLVRNIGVLRSPTALIITLAWCFFSGLNLNFTMMVPFAMESQGYTQEEASWGLSISNICSLVAGIVVSSMADLPKFSLCRAFIICNSIVVVSTVAFCFVDGLVWVNVVLGVWGMGVGVVSSLSTLIMVTYMGLDKYMAILGVSGVLKGFWLMACGPLLGVIRDVSGSYTVTLCFLATTDLISIILFFFLPAARAYDAKKAEEERERKYEEVPRRKRKELEDVR